MELHGGNIYKVEKQFNISKKDIIDFSSNINPLGISKNLKKEITGNLDMLQNYPDPEYSDLKQTIAEYSRTDIENVLAGNGATELIFLFARTIKFKKALIVAPAFIEYALALGRSGTKIDYFRQEEKDGFVLNPDRLIKKLYGDYDLLVLCNPNNPTSGFTSTDKIIGIIKAAKKYGITVMLDESFIEFVDPVLVVQNTDAFRRFGNLFLLRSLTKFFAIPGLRLGYALAFNKDLYSKIKKSQEPWTVNQIADLAGRVLLKDKEYIEASAGIIEKERKFLYDNLCEIKWLAVYKPYANFILLKLMNNFTSSELKTELLKHKLLIRDASNFKFLNNKFVRIAVKDEQSNELLLRQLRNLQ
jgi:threonine-phosphate decarboxylase